MQLVLSQKFNAASALSRESIQLPTSITHIVRTSLEYNNNVTKNVIFNTTAYTKTPRNCLNGGGGHLSEDFTSTVVSTSVLTRVQLFTKL